MMTSRRCIVECPHNHDMADDDDDDHRLSLRVCHIGFGNRTYYDRDGNFVFETEYENVTPSRDVSEINPINPDCPQCQRNLAHFLASIAHYHTDKRWLERLRKFVVSHTRALNEGSLEDEAAMAYQIDDEFKTHQSVLRFEGYDMDPVAWAAALYWDRRLGVDITEFDLEFVKGSGLWHGDCAICLEGFGRVEDNGADNVRKKRKSTGEEEYVGRECKRRKKEDCAVKEGRVMGCSNKIKDCTAAKCEVKIKKDVKKRRDKKKEEKEELIRLPCNHLFHDRCILEWVKKTPTCPLCRSDLQKSTDE